MRNLLRAEHFAIFIAATMAYTYLGYAFWMFAILFLVPDLTFVGYLFGNKVGAVVYNIGHSLIGPLLLLTVGLFIQHDLSIQLGLIWLAHIGFDRTLGYGLKTFKGFNFTHLGTIGRIK